MTGAIRILGVLTGDGTRSKSAGARGGGAGVGEDLFQVVQTESYDLTPSRDGAIEAHDFAPQGQSQLCRVTLADGRSIWLTTERLRELLEVSPDQPLVLGPETQLVPGEQRRGLLKWGLKALKLVGIDWQAAAVRLTTRELIERIESKLYRGGPGIYRCRFDKPGDDSPYVGDALGALDTEPEIPALVLLHGTFSSTLATFGDLWSREGFAGWHDLADGYNRQIFALEHATLSASPIGNAIRLLKALPNNQRLHLLSHSRGGLVGELVARAWTDDDREAISPDDIAAYLASYPDDQHPTLRAELEELRTLLRDKRPRVERFVRVACPAAGTYLADDKIDLYLGNVLGTLDNLLDFVPFPGIVKDTIHLGQALLLAVARQRNDSSVIPGVAAQRTDSGLVRLINMGPRLKSDLTVISGDAESAGFSQLFQTLASKLADMYWEGQPNDFVVESSSMLRGHRRVQPVLYAHFRSHTVNHFSYFRTRDSSSAIIKGLQRADTETRGFRLIEEIDLAARARARGGISRPDRPYLVMLPGFAGTHLAYKDNRVWLDLLDIVRGQFVKLGYTGGPGFVTPDGWMERYYGDFAAELGNRYNVTELPFDWRLSLRENAEILRGKLETVQEAARRHQQPIRLLAHSIGGMVSLYLILSNRTLWRRLCDEFDARLVMAGSPVRGTHRTLMLLTGRHRLLNLIAAIDPRHKRKELIEQMAGMPGLLEALPRWGQQNLFAGATWHALFTADTEGRDDWVVPDQTRLDAAWNVARVLDGEPGNPERVIYLAGQDEITPNAWMERNGSLEFPGTPDGDGLAPWEQSIPAWAKTWYVPAVEHGNLFAKSRYFSAVEELLDRGSTARLSQQPPAAKRGAGAARSLSGREPIPAFPDQADLEAALMHGRLGGRGIAAREREGLRGARCRISVLHDDLRSVQQPIMVGQYLGDPIDGATMAVDRKLHGALSRHKRHAIYPGVIGSYEIINDAQDETQDPAIVVGLGRPGELTGPDLRRGLAEAMLRFGLYMHERARREREPPDTLSLTTLMVGSWSLNAEDSVRALCSAVYEANQRLSAMDTPAIGELTILDLYEDRAICAAQALAGMSPQLPDELRIDTCVLSGDGGQKHRASDCDRGDWWRRLLIDGRRNALVFTPITERAGVPTEIQDTDRVILDRLLEQATRNTGSDETIDATLFELLIPPSYKEQVYNDQGLVVVIDKASARYPWEMLRDHFRGDQRPVATEMGLLRQLRLDAFTPTSKPASDSGVALVVGDPKSNFVPLPAARAEARSVHDRLCEAGFIPDEAQPLIGAVGTRIIERVMLSDCQVMHLAGHGVFDFVLDTNDIDPATGNPRTSTGMVLGDGLFFGAPMVKAMRRLPELVFINCCHLGATAEEHPELHYDRHRLAANLGTQFIESGVKAVIAAGWEVDDAAAEVFAARFYDALLFEGLSFGDAVLAARRDTYERYPRVNTWGAYQCYGEPTFKLTQSERFSRKQKGKKDDPATGLHAQSQLVEFLQDRAASRDIPSAHESRHLLREVDDVLAGCPGVWSESAAVNEALGALYGEHGLFEKAVGYYAEAQLSEDGKISLHAIEQKNNLIARWAEAVCNPPAVSSDGSAAGQPRKSDRAALIKHVQCAIEELARLLQFGETRERLNILGSAYKHRALLHPSREFDAMVGDLLMAEQQYRNAADRSGAARHYPELNALICAVLAKRLKMERTSLSISALNTRLDNIEQEMQKARSQNLWLRADLVNTDLLRLVGDLKRQHAHDILGLERRYADVLEFASARERDSVVKQIRFLWRVLSQIRRPDAEERANTTAILQLYQQLHA